MKPFFSLLIGLSFILLARELNAQEFKIDSINYKLSILSSPQQKCEYLLDVSDQIQHPDKDFIPYILYAVDLAMYIHSLPLLAHSLKQAGYIYYYNGMHVESVIYFNKAILVYRELHDHRQMINCFNMLANLYYFNGEYGNAIIANKSILKLSRMTKDNYKLATAYRQIGTNFIMLKEYDSAYPYLRKAITLTESSNDSLAHAYNFSDLGFYYYNTGNYQKAIKYQHKALRYCPDSKTYTHARFLIYNRMAKSFLELKNLDSAQYYVKKAMANQSILKLKIVSHIIAAEISIQEGKYDQAIKYLKSSEKIAVGMRNFSKLAKIYNLYLYVYRQKGDMDNYLYYSVLSQRNYDSIREENLNVQFENVLIYNKIEEFKKQLERLIQQERQKQEQIKKYKRLLLFLGLIMVSIIIILYQKIIYVKKLEQKNRIIRKQNVEIIKQSQKLKEQKDYLEYQNDLIEESLHCAFSIQQTVLPSTRLMKEVFSEYYLLYRPMHIVSGDFYWIAKLTGKTSFVVLADGTGHGVPGAFISLITERLLEEIIYLKRIFDPVQILENLKYEFDKLIKNSSTYMITLGVEIIVMKFAGISKDEFELTYGSARLPFIYYKPGEGLKMIVSRGKSIGGIFSSQLSYFDSGSFIVTKDTVFYLFTDGFKDQICKQDGRRINTKKFYKLIDSIKDEPIKEQGKLLEDYLDKCIQDIEQRDDISVLIFKLR